MEAIVDAEDLGAAVVAEGMEVLDLRNLLFGRLRGGVGACAGCAAQEEAGSKKNGNFRFRRELKRNRLWKQKRHPEGWRFRLNLW
jgi:hypothetical protein